MLALTERLRPSFTPSSLVLPSTSPNVLTGTMMMGTEVSVQTGENHSQGKSDSPRGDTAKVLNIQRANEIGTESEGRKRETEKEIRFAFECYPMNLTTFSVLADLTNCLSSFKARGDSLRLIIVIQNGRLTLQMNDGLLEFYGSF
ncbi:hypothetical protein DBV15_09012 [Temnothorax longispinosus]|uniref:Uncharacterized protein n=1 Tax=Temnothorax longispinosus TaxID=300112 RepID=A0A4S2KG89_9HYME|nr:hypothetical protein DBV15_09012 [Temnothorax longispinosus]